MNYFRYYKAWRVAFLELMDREQPTEVACQGRENKERWIYREPRFTDIYEKRNLHTQTPAAHSGKTASDYATTTAPADSRPEESPAEQDH